jgi:hypothetical protein
VEGRSAVSSDGGGDLLYAGAEVGEGAGEMWRWRAWAESLVGRCTSGMGVVVVQEERGSERGSLRA